MPPTHGVRFELLRVDGAPSEVRYAVALHGPEALWKGQAAVQLAGGELQLSPFEPAEPPAWAVTTLRAFLRGEWRARRDDPQDPWPARITRWRAER